MEISIPIQGIINSLQLVQTPPGSIINASWMKQEGAVNGETAQTNGYHPNGNGVDIGKDKETKTGMVLVVAAIGQEPRTGRWLRVGDGAKNCAVVVPLQAGS
jgi:ribosomal RNA-processing protein 9